MKYRPSIAFNQFSGTARNITASSNAAGCYLHTKSQGGTAAPTSQQQQVKALFASLQKSWKDLTQAQMNLWQNAAQTQAGRAVLGQNAQITGINLYLRLNFWVVKCGGTALATPPVLNGVESPADCIATASQNRIGIQLSAAPAAAGLKLVILVSAPQTIGTVTGVGRGASCTDPVTASATFVNIRSAYVAKYGVPAAATPKIFFRYFLVNPATGEKSLERLTTAIYSEEVTYHTLTLTSNNPAYGTVSPAQPTQYPQGTPVSISATPTAGYAFTKWSDNNTQNPRTLTMNEDKTLQAVFSVDNYRRISTESTPTGTGSVTGGGSYLIGTQVTLQAVPEEGCCFDHWEDDEWAPPTRQITVSANASYHAIFHRGSMQHNVQISVDKPLLGTTDPEPDTYPRYDGDVMEIYVIPDEDYGGVFLRWEDGNTSNPRTVTVNCNMKLRALFTSEYEANVAVDWEGEGQVIGGGTYHLGDTATVQAIPGIGQSFIRWEDGGTDPVRTFVVTEDVLMYAYFTEE